MIIASHLGRHCTSMPLNDDYVIPNTSPKGGGQSLIVLVFSHLYYDQTLKMRDCLHKLLMNLLLK